MNNLFESTLGTALREQAAKYGGKEFMVFPNRNIRLSFSDIDKKADVLAKGMLAAGFMKGDHIGIWASNVNEWPIVFYAAARLGIVTVPLNINSKNGEISFILEHADIKGLFFIEKFRDTDLVEVLYQIIPELKKSVSGNVRTDQFPCLKTVVLLGSNSREGIQTIVDMAILGTQITDVTLKTAETNVSCTDLLCIIYTSGTTGFPKGAMLTHSNIMNNSYYSNRFGAMDENSVVLATLPFFYITSLTSVIVESVVFGYKVVVLENFDTVKCLEIIQREKCTCVYGVPTMYFSMLNCPLFNSIDMTSVKYACIGGAVCLPDLMKTVIERMKLDGLYVAYGLTETSPVVTDAIIESISDARITTVGDPIPGVEISIRTANTECPVNVQGEICVRGHNVMKGYYKMKEAIHDVIDKNGWFHTGDLGHLLSNGYLVIDGRIKELIIRGGEKVFPLEVENLLLTISGIQSAQVAGIPSKKYGEEVGAFVILKPGTVISEEEVRTFCKNKISHYKVPQYVFFMESFPLSASGKVQKFKLSENGLNLLRENGVLI
jgi:fatty-acyl-CoA synthase